MEKINLEKFRSLHDEAYLYIKQAITQEKPEINRQDVALLMYQKGLGILDQALCTDTEGVGPDYEKARAMQEKMVNTRTHVQERIENITDRLAPPLNRSEVPSRPSRPPRQSGLPSCPQGPSTRPSEPPSRPSQPPTRPSQPQNRPPGLPSYEEATRLPDRPPTYSQSRDTSDLNVDSELDEIANEATEERWLIDATGGPAKEATERMKGGGVRNSDSSCSLSEQGEVVFSMPQVQIFHITPSGEVTTPSYPETLHIIKFSVDLNDENVAPAFIQVGSWTYPLIRGKSPILKSSFGGYMFPDLESGLEGASVGLIFPDTVTESDRSILELWLTELTSAFKSQAEIDAEYEEYKEFSGALATSLVKGAEVLGNGMVKGAVKTSELLFTGADYAKQYIAQEAPRPVDPRLIKGLDVARVVSTGACKVSGWMVSKVGSATMALGRMAAPHLERSASKALTHFSGQSSAESTNQLKIVGEVASGTLAAVSTLYMALENSSKILAKNLANNTVMIVSHKYGTDCAAATDAAFSTAGNSYLAFYNATALGPKGIAKRAAKDTGKAMVGFDPESTSQRASRAPDENIGVDDVIQPFIQKEKPEKQ